MDTFKYRAGDELPGITLPWQEQTGPNTWADLDLSTGYTFTVRLLPISGADAVTVNATVTGYNGGVTIDWAVDDLAIAPGFYELDVVAHETATNKDRTYSPEKRPIVRIVS